VPDFLEQIESERAEMDEAVLNEASKKKNAGIAVTAVEKTNLQSVGGEIFREV
jgi:hypothetical protein